MNDIIHLTVPRAYQRAIRKAYIRSAVWNMRHCLKRADGYDKMYQDFKERYSAGTLHKKHLDGAIDWYLNPLNACADNLSTLPNTPDTLALDLGCGPASVGHWMRAKDYHWSYHGVDLIAEGANYFTTLKDARFTHKDMEDLQAQDIAQKPDIIFAVNSLSYLDNMHVTLEKLHALSHDKTQLHVIDAYPSLLWNRKAAGVIMKPHEMAYLLNRSGWRVEKTFQLSVYTLFGKPFLNISQGFFCRRKAEI